MAETNKLIANQDRLKKKQEIYSNPRLEKGDAKLKPTQKRERNPEVGKLDAQAIVKNTVVKGFGNAESTVSPQDMANQISRMLKGEEKDGGRKR